jgi:hypothetical protein
VPFAHRNTAHVIDLSVQCRSPRRKFESAAPASPARRSLFSNFGKDGVIALRPMTADCTDNADGTNGILGTRVHSDHSRAARPSPESAISMPKIRRNVCARHSRRRARADFLPRLCRSRCQSDAIPVHARGSCETTLWPAGAFARAYAANRGAAIKSIVEADPVATCAMRSRSAALMIDRTAQSAESALRGSRWT